MSFANLRPSQRRKGQWTRCAEILRLCWIGGYRTKSVASRLDMDPTKVSECLMKLRKRGLVKEGWGRCEVTELGRAECERLWPQKRTG